MKFSIEFKFERNRSQKDGGWRRLTSLDELPKNKTFLLLDDKATSGVSVYEAMIFDNNQLGCPSASQDYEMSDFSHWRPMLEMPK